MFRIRCASMVWSRSFDLFKWNLFRSKAVKGLIFLLQKIPTFLHTCTTCSALPSNISIVFWLLLNIFFFVHRPTNKDISISKDWNLREIYAFIMLYKLLLRVKHGIRNRVKTRTSFCQSAVYTVCPRSSDPFYTVSYFIKWVTTSWTCSIFRKRESERKYDSRNKS